jgi:hypothetical protein
MSDDLIALEVKARNAHIDVEVAHGKALARALDAGDALREIVRRGLVAHGQRTTLYARTGISTRVGQIYIRLAEHRALIEEANTNRDSCLTITAAVRLISKGDRNPKRSRTSPEAAAKAAAVKAAKPEAPLPDFSGMTNADWTRALEALGLDRFFEVMPEDWRGPIQDRSVALFKSKQPKKQLWSPKPSQPRHHTHIH